MAVPPGDASRHFVVGKAGQIFLIRNGAVEPTPYLNISSGFGLINGGETGLLGMAIHPGFNTPSSPGLGKFYTYTSEQKGTNSADFFRPISGPNGGSHHNVLREWTVDPAADVVANPATASRVLFRTANPAGNHNGGAVKFGPDGLLYISLGDGGVSVTAQDTTLIFGKIARIDPTAANPPNGRYGIPADNPFAGAGDPGLDEIYAYGLRNPFRMQFDSLTGELYLGDVGGTIYEEVNKIARGENYGWPHFEGLHQHSAPPPGSLLTPPLAQYGRTWGASVIGGFIYRGSDIPELYGKYVFADAFHGSLRYMDAGGGQIYTLPVIDGASFATGVYGWGEDADGELYALTAAGHVSRLAQVPEPAALGVIAAAACGARVRRRSSSAN